jgi:hypothetical protein
LYENCEGWGYSFGFFANVSSIDALTLIGSLTGSVGIFAEDQTTPLFDELLAVSYFD